MEVIRKDKIKFSPYIVLTLFTLLLLLLPIGEGNFFGSEGDWYSQHVGAAEALRQTMLEQGTIFPQHINIGAGINSYDLAYYGLLRPDVLISCLFKDIPMKYIIAVYALIGAAASVNLCFFWLKRKGIDMRFTVMGAVMMASATCFFHAHRQIMFVNYMPFLIMALIGIDVLIEKRKSLLLIVSSFLICLHSFFYAPTCLIVCVMYYFSCLWNSEISDKFSVTVKAILSLAVSVGMAVILLLPTAMDILSTEKDGGVFAKEAVKAINLSFDGLLYSSYGCGLTLISLYGLILAVKNGRRRKLAIAVLACLMMPVVSLALSGFLYSRGKILMPFLPVIIWICIDTLGEIFRDKERVSVVCALICLITSAFSQWKWLIIAEVTLILIWAALSRIEKFYEKSWTCAISILMIVAIALSYNINRLGEDYIKIGDERQNRFSSEEISHAASDYRYRFDYLSDNFVCSNFVADGRVNKTAMYSSVSNSLYSNFYYDTMANPISSRNRVALIPNQNIFFNYFMGIRYVLAEADKIPGGYEKLLQKDGYVIAENKNVLPICYGSYDVISEEDYRKIKFPDTLAVLTKNTVVKTGTGSQVTPEAEEISATWEDRQIQLSRPVKDKAVIVSFNINRKDGKEVVIEINGMSNKLSSKDAPYPNENYHFNYVLSIDESTSVLETDMTESEYTIEDFKVYIMDLPDRDVEIPISYSKLKNNQVFEGTIDMARDGYFVTSYPYKDGYRVKVDGKETDAQIVNTAFVGFPLDKGEHSIEICYTAPGFWTGAVVSIISFAAAAIIVIRERKKRI